MASATEKLELAGADELDEHDGAARRIGVLVGGVYRITRYLGSGGSSHVFEAEHQRLGKPFAVKLLRPEIGHGKKTAQRFRREAKAVARLQSEHIVSVIDCGELEDQTPYVVMELLDGEDLRSLLNRERLLPVRRAIQILVEACRGLRTVHEAGLVHRDLKPENLFIARRATGADWCKVLDFGVAKMEASLSTAQGAIVGTVRYMAPEQLANSSAVAPTTDVYALGAILYECLTGKPLNQGETVQEVMYSVMNREPAALHELRPELPRALANVVARATSKEPEARPTTALELASELASAVSSVPDSATSLTLAEDALATSTTVATIRPFARSAWTAATLAGLTGFMVGWLSTRGEPPAARGPSDQPTPPVAMSQPPSRSPPRGAPVSSASNSPPNVTSSASPTTSTTPPRWRKATIATKPVSEASKSGLGPASTFDEANPYAE